MSRDKSKKLVAIVAAFAAVFVIAYTTANTASADPAGGASRSLPSVQVQ